MTKPLRLLRSSQALSQTKIFLNFCDFCLWGTSAWMIILSSRLCVLKYLENKTSWSYCWLQQKPDFFFLLFSTYYFKSIFLKHLLIILFVYLLIYFVPNFKLDIWMISMRRLIVGFLSFLTFQSWWIQYTLKRSGTVLYTFSLYICIILRNLT